MSKVLGKRKARDADAKPALDPEDAQEIFRRHFEAQFKPLAVEPIRPLPQTVEAEDDEDSGSEAEDSEWGGISEDEEGMLHASPQSLRPGQLTEPQTTA